MDLFYLEKTVKQSIQKQCPKLPKQIIDEFVTITFWGAPWIIYGDNQELYILGISESKYDFYYFGCTENLEIKLISCALNITKNKERINDYLPKFDEDFKKWSKDSKVIWKTIRKNIKEYFKKNKQDKLLYFQDHILSDEHIVYDDEEHIKYHIEKIKK